MTLQLIPPPPGASVAAVVGHYLRQLPEDADSQTSLVFYRRLLAAMDAAPKSDRRYTYDEGWYVEMRDCVQRCIDSHAARCS
ncbi:hypothetical protein [Amycolatopsis nigrescens]|uniref:hypothetical protein n=1 Tax=Amycolatopsis nigrescens TaxID=381445 RepID=UPI0003A491DA|nr:hypothetical protein [Amycolatopsis nigrescens]